MFTIEPWPLSSMPGRNARIVRCIDLTLRSNEKSQSSSEQSSTVPLCTKPAALSRMSVLPARLAMAATAALSRTSSFATSAIPSLLSAASLASSISVANTVAPSRAKATAQARPIPTAAAVTNARLPFRRSDMKVSSKWYELGDAVVVIARSEATKQSMPTQWRNGLLRCARNDGGGLMIIPRHADRARNILIARGELHAGAGGLLADGRAIQLLPRRLVGRVGEAALGLQLGAALLQFIA